jgi:hypothetical protein
MAIRQARTEYRLMGADNAPAFQRIVNDALQKSWVLYGNPFYADGMFRQAMTFYHQEMEWITTGKMADKETNHVPVPTFI